MSAPAVEKLVPFLGKYVGVLRTALVITGFALFSANGVAAEAYGIGLALAKHPDGFLVTKVLSNSPAELSGSIAEGDLITAVAQSNAPPVALHNFEFMGQAVALIRGPKDSVVRLTVIPGATNTAQTKTVSLVRGELRGIHFGGLWLSVLTNGAMIPDIELVRLPDKAKERLRDHLGKFVVLEFWATWCGPCLKLMPETQKQAERFATRKDVICITASMDDSPDVAAARLRANGWNKTRNTWADRSVAEAFGVGSLPRMFVINPQGRIEYLGYPLPTEALDRLLEGKTKDAR